MIGVLEVDCGTSNKVDLLFLLVEDVITFLISIVHVPSILLSGPVSHPWVTYVVDKKLC